MPSAAIAIHQQRCEYRDDMGNLHDDDDIVALFDKWMPRKTYHRQQLLRVGFAVVSVLDTTSQTAAVFLGEVACSPSLQKKEKSLHLRKQDADDNATLKADHEIPRSN